MLIDFGNAVLFRDQQPPYIPGVYGYNYPPEMKPGGICHAYRAEIWCLGFMIQEIVESVRESRNLVVFYAKYAHDSTWIRNIKENSNIWNHG
jgi:hypothetical protein